MFKTIINAIAFFGSALANGISEYNRINSNDHMDNYRREEYGSHSMTVRDDRRPYRDDPRYDYDRRDYRRDYDGYDRDRYYDDDYGYDRRDDYYGRDYGRRDVYDDYDRDYRRDRDRYEQRRRDYDEEESLQRRIRQLKEEISALKDRLMKLVKKNEPVNEVPIQPVVIQQPVPQVPAIPYTEPVVNAPSIIDVPTVDTVPATTSLYGNLSQEAMSAGDAWDKSCDDAVRQIMKPNPNVCGSLATSAINTSIGFNPMNGWDQYSTSRIHDMVVDTRNANVFGNNFENPQPFNTSIGVGPVIDVTRLKGGHGPRSFPFSCGYAPT